MLIGTPISEDKPEYVPVWNQKATDENGKRRFHGAFTGGFTAGYYGTVGSKEGFQPQTFKSSRKDRKSVSNQRIEDFMDEEDFEQSIAGGKILATKDAFTNPSEQEESSTSFRNTKLFVPDDLLAPVKESIGIQLLRLMGWKPGDEINLRLPSKRKRTQSIDKIDKEPKKRKMGPSLEDLTGTNDIEEKIEDPSIYLSKIRKTEDVRGLGCITGDSNIDNYRNLKSNESSSSIKLRMDSILSSDSERVSKKFGQGIFEDTDDIDVYDNISMSNYDVELTSEKKQSKSTIQTWDYKPSFKFYGNLSTEGKTYPPPKIPDDYEPIHKFSKSLEESKDSIALSSSKRGEILGERQLPVRPKPETPIPTSGGSKTYLPFSDNPQKQLRYVAFLQNRYEEASTDLHDFVKEDEKREFSRVRDKFKEIPDSLKGRFTKSTPESQKKIEEEAKREKEEKEASNNQSIPNPIREVEDWAPAKLLCKRFGEKDPYLNSIPQLRIKKINTDNEPLFKLPEHVTSTPMNLQVNEIKEPTIQELEEEIPSKPDMAIFKAIFEDSDSESDEE